MTFWIWIKNKIAITMWIEYMVTVFSLLLVVLLPVYLQNGFFDVDNAKYAIYSNITKRLLPVLFGMVILCFIFNYRQWNVPKILKNISVLDSVMIVYLLCVLLSSALSRYHDKIWAGYPGWFMGLYSQLSFVCIYFLLSRYAENAKTILFFLCGTTGCVCLLGVLNRFLIDPLGVYIGLSDINRLLFLSTLGQATWYSSFVCTVFPIGLYFFWDSKKRWVRISGGIFSFLGFSSLVTQNSDSAYIALLCFMGVFFLFSVADIWHLQRFMQLVILFLSAVKGIYAGTKILQVNMIGSLDTLSLFLINGNFVWGLLIIAIGIWGLLLWCQKRELYHAELMKKIRNVLYIILGVLIAAAVAEVVLQAKGKIPERIASLLSQIPYLTWSDDWGNGRGFIWRLSGNMFNNMNIWEKLFGVGPDCYYYYAYDFAPDELSAVWGSIAVTNAHNEWFTAVINYGIFGGIAYLGIFASAAAGYAKKAARSPILIGILACVLSYVGHNLFCYQTVLCTPFIFLLMGIGEWYRRQEN